MTNKPLTISFQALGVDATIPNWRLVATYTHKPTDKQVALVRFGPGVVVSSILSNAAGKLEVLLHWDGDGHPPFTLNSEVEWLGVDMIGLMATTAKYASITIGTIKDLLK